MTTILENKLRIAYLTLRNAHEAANQKRKTYHLSKSRSMLDSCGMTNIV
ncbi:MULTISPECIES: hypothetical protein [unclassified Polaribacter]|nr:MULTISPECIES: hypothetical protein [unclassified Polaribacter]